MIPSVSFKFLQVCMFANEFCTGADIKELNKLHLRWSPWSSCWLVKALVTVVWTSHFKVNAKSVPTTMQFWVGDVLNMPDSSQNKWGWVNQIMAAGCYIFPFFVRLISDSTSIPDIRLKHNGKLVKRITGNIIAQNKEMEHHLAKLPRYTKV